MTGQELKEWRTRMGWIQQKAADELGITRAWYQQMEKGKRAVTNEPVTIERRTYLACMALEHLNLPAVQRVST